jgi:hypothetical protein
MATPWGVVEDAIAGWVRLGCGLPTGQLAYAHQDGPKPPRPFVTIALGGITPVGLDDSEELVRPDTDSPPPGQEIEIRAGGLREFLVTLTCSTAGVRGTSSARAILSQVQAALALPSVMNAFLDAGISCFDAGRVLDVSTVLDAAHEGRAVLECRFYTTESFSEYAGHITTVQLVDVENGNRATVVP